MKKSFTSALFVILLVIIASCKKKPEPEKQPDIIEQLKGANPTPSGISGIDTSKIIMRVEINGMLYITTYNFSMILPGLYGQQIWINGSTFPLLRVLTLRFPPDIIAGTYQFQQNSKYDAVYVPSGSINYNVDNGKLIILKHDKANKIIQGTFEFKATNLDSPAQSSLDFKNGSFTVKY